MTKRWTTAAGIAALCATMSAYAQVTVDVTHTWSDPGLCGWTNGMPVVVISNTDGYLNITFPDQTSPSSQSDTMYSNITESVALTNISFRFLATDIFPSAVRLYVHSANSGNSWYVALPDVAVGEWTTFDVPVDFGAMNWMMGPGSSESQFLSDMLSVDWVGVYVRRHGDVIAQNYGLDDFRIQGVTLPESVSISGIVGYSGELDGAFVVSLTGTSVATNVTIPGPGSYEFNGLALGNEYTVSAYRDSNGNNTQEFWEASGAWAENPARVYISNLTGVDIMATDPKASDGLPYWWLNKYFGVTNAIGYGGGGESLAGMDSDGDGANNYAEYRAGSDPTNFLSAFRVDISEVSDGSGGSRIIIGWESESNKTYAVWRSDDMPSGFTMIESGITNTAPRNEYEDLTATNAMPYCYRIQLE